MSEAGIHKAAVLMLALGQDEAAEVMKYLEPREVQKLGTAMSTLKTIAHEDLEAVLQDFETESARNASFGVDAEDYIRTVLTKALGDDKASNLLNRILVTRDSSGIESLKWMDAKSVADLIRLEHPQIIATILVHLDAIQASEILSEFSERTRMEVILRIATMEGLQPQAIQELNDVLTQLLTGNENIKKKSMGGIKATAAIMNFMKSDLETALMTKVREFDADIADQITDQMFVFDDIIDIEDRDIQIILREVPSDALITALKGAKQDIQAKIFKNMSQRAAEMMREDLESKGPVRLSDVDKQQKEILQIIRRLSDEGQITLSSGGDDAFV